MNNKENIRSVVDAGYAVVKNRFHLSKTGKEEYKIYDFGCKIVTDVTEEVYRNVEDAVESYITHVASRNS